MKIGRVCSRCGTRKTSLDKRKNGTYFEHWYNDSNNGSWCKYCYKAITRASTIWYRKMKHEVFVYYFGEFYKCARCGVNDIRVLQMHHVNGGGDKQRLEIFGNKNKGGMHFYAWLKSQGYPKLDLECLCGNCHTIFEIELIEKRYVKPLSEISSEN